MKADSPSLNRTQVWRMERNSFLWHGTMAVPLLQCNEKEQMFHSLGVLRYLVISAVQQGSFNQRLEKKYVDELCASDEKIIFGSSNK